jgi:hypothetical protein
MGEAGEAWERREKKVSKLGGDRGLEKRREEKSIICNNYYDVDWLKKYY